MELYTELKLKLCQQLFSVKHSHIFKGHSHFTLLQLVHDLGLFFSSTYVTFNFHIMTEEKKEENGVQA